jgi:hypothetical protein
LEEVSNTDKTTTIEQLRATANRVKGFIGGIVTDIADAIPTKTSEIENDNGYVSVMRKMITISQDSWIEATDTTEESRYLYTYSLSDKDITASCRADVILDAASVNVAAEAEMYPGTETSNGVVVFRAVSIPTADLTGQMYLCDN